jgi:hypothetical protein
MKIFIIRQFIISFTPKTLCSALSREVFPLLYIPLLRGPLVDANARYHKYKLKSIRIESKAIPVIY